MLGAGVGAEEGAGVGLPDGRGLGADVGDGDGCAIVLGNEGAGMRKMVRAACAALVREGAPLPMHTSRRSAPLMMADEPRENLTLAASTLNKLEDAWQRYVLLRPGMGMDELKETTRLRTAQEWSWGNRAPGTARNQRSKAVHAISTKGAWHERNAAMRVQRSPSSSRWPSSVCCSASPIVPIAPAVAI